MHDKPPANASRPERWMPWLLIAAGVFVYANSLSGPFIFDDDSIEHNEHIRQLWPPWRAMVAPPQSSLSARPITSLTFAVNYALGGLDVVGYHITNLAIHICAGLTLFGIIRRTLLHARFRRFCGNGESWLAMVATLFWIVHPLQTESVTYLIQRTESLMGLFYLLTLYCLVRAASGGHSKRWYAGSIVACVLGMGCKEVMATAPLVVLLYDRTFLSNSLRRAFRIRWMYYGALAASWLWLGWLATTDPRSDSAGFSLAHVGPLDYAQSQFGVVARYLKLAVWPDALCLYYDLPVVRNAGDIVPYAILVGGLLVASVWAARRRSAMGFLGASFFLALAPTSSFIPITDLAFEHRMYLPLAALCIVFVVAGHRVLPSIHGGIVSAARRRTTIRCLSVIAIAALLGVRTMQRNHDYRSAVSIWSTVVSQRPGVWRAHYNLGCALAAEDRRAESIPHYRRALQLNPYYVDAYINMCIALESQGRFAEALQHCRFALGIKPDCCRAFLHMGIIHEWLAEHEEAILHLQAALECDRDFAEAHFYVGQILAGSGQVEKGMRHLHEARRLRPDWSAPADALIAIRGAQPAGSDRIREGG